MSNSLAPRAPRGIHHGRRSHGRSVQASAGAGPDDVTGNLSDAWLYVVAPIVGAIVAALVHTALTWLTQQPTTAAEPASIPAE